LGGKGAGLARLVGLGMPVPEFVVLTVAAWRPDAEAPEEEDFTSLWREVSAWGDVRLAVRSSAAVEDGASASWAGQFESVLGVRGEAELRAAVARCWASGRSERVAAYGAAHGQRAGAMAVVVQRLLEGEASGVMFTADPEWPERSLISVGWGLGEGVVQGRVPCDTWRVAPGGRAEVELEDKDEAVLLVNGEPAVVEVPAERRREPALSEGTAIELAELGWRLAKALGRPQDVEFTLADGRLALLQTRPITIAIPQGRRLLWDNSNIVESYSGVTTPLTFSFASRAYTIVYQLFCRVMGVDEAVIRENEPTFRRMIGLVRGRIYYNLNAWYRLVSLLPGYAFSKEAMETMMGVSEVASEEDAGPQEARFLAGLRLGRMLGGLGWRLFRLDADADAFQRKFQATLQRVRGLELEALRPDELLALYEEVERELLWAWSPPLVNDFFCMIFYRLLQKRCQALTGDPATQLHHRLLGGEGLASAAPAEEIADFGRWLAGRPELVNVLLSADPPEARLARLREDADFRARWDAWMDRFGDRSPDELKLESPTLADTPGFLLGALAPFVRADGPAPRAFGEAEREARRLAEVEVAAAPMSFVQRRIFGFVLRNARSTVARRESLRFERTRIFGFVRRLFRALGDCFVEGGLLDARDDVFYLTVDEALGAVRGTSATTDLRGTAALRRAEFAGFAEAPPPDERFHTWGAVQLGNRFVGLRKAAPLPEGDVMQGTPCAPGVVRARARLIRDPRQTPDLAGDLLCAHRTDPGWVPLFPTAGGVLVERGSLLSHSAVVARELGLPAVVGLKGLMDWLEDGEMIEMDGTAGTVRRLGKAGEVARG
jgi:pyruvate,water dikinase